MLLPYWRCWWKLRIEQSSLCAAIERKSSNFAALQLTQRNAPPSCTSVPVFVFLFPFSMVILTRMIITWHPCSVSHDHNINKFMWGMFPTGSVMGKKKDWVVGTRFWELQRCSTKRGVKHLLFPGPWLLQITKKSIPRSNCAVVPKLLWCGELQIGLFAMTESFAAKVVVSC